MSTITLSNVKTFQDTNIVVSGGTVPEKIKYGIDLLWTQFPDMSNIPDSTMHCGHIYVPFKYSSVTLYSEHLMIEPDMYHHTVGIPPIAYDDIQEISFDTFLDHSCLVAMWIVTKYGIFSIACY